MKTVLLAGAMCLAIGIAATPAQALPTLQVYATNATAGTLGEDEDTWFTGPNFELQVVIAFTGNIETLSDIKLVVSVPEGEQGTLDINGATLINTAATVDLLLNVIGNDGYDTKLQALGESFNNHYPFHDDVSDFLVYDLNLGTLNKADFSNSMLPDYNADDGTITYGNAKGQISTFDVEFTGFSWIHLDVVALATTKQGVEAWVISPGSHDVTAIPLPASAWSGLAMVGLLGAVRIYRNRRARLI